MVITCRFATLPRALFDEGDDELLVGVCDRGLRPKQRSRAIEHRRAPSVAGRCVRGGSKCTARINSKRATFMARLLPLKDVKRGFFDTGSVTWTAFPLVAHLSGRAQQLMTGPDTARHAQARWRRRRRTHSLSQSHRTFAPPPLRNRPSARLAD
jgi:hypothetical protein